MKTFQAILLGTAVAFVISGAALGEATGPNGPDACRAKQQKRIDNLEALKKPGHWLHATLDIVPGLEEYVQEQIDTATTAKGNCGKDPGDSSPD